MVALLALVAIAKPSGLVVVVNQQSDTATIVDLASHKTVHVPVGNGPHEAAVSPNGKRAAVTNYFKQGTGPGSSLSVLDLTDFPTAASQTPTPVRFAHRPSPSRFDPRGGVIAQMGFLPRELSPPPVYDRPLPAHTASRRGVSLDAKAAAQKGIKVKTIPLDRQAMPHGVQWVDDRQLVCTDERNQRLLLVDVDAGKVVRQYATGQGGSHMLSLHLGSNRLVSSNMGGGSVTLFDFKSGERLETVSTGKECEGVGIAPDGTTIWAGNRAEDTISVIDMATRKVVKKIDSKGFPYRVQFTPNGKWALIPHAVSGELVVCSVAEMSVVRRIKVGGSLVKVANPSPAGVWPYADSNFALVTIRNDNSVVLVDLHSGETLTRIEVGSSPDGVAMRPEGRQAAL